MRIDLFLFPVATWSIGPGSNTATPEYGGENHDIPTDTEFDDDDHVVLIRGSLRMQDSPVNNRDKSFLDRVLSFICVRPRMGAS